MKKNIVLIGFMGTGKTSVGIKLSERLNMNFIDSDDEISKKAGMSIIDIFEEFGEEYFRELERYMIKKISDLEGYIISTGGGVVKDENNIINLKKNGVIFHLKGSPKKIEKNLSNEINKRPLLKCEHVSEKIKSLLMERENLYQKALDYEINIDYLSIDEVADRIIKIYKNII